MKKFLSLVLSILMIISVTPFALAAACEHIFDSALADRSACTFLCGACGETVSYELADYSIIDTLFAYDPSLNLYTTDEYAEMANNDFQPIFDEFLENIPENLSTYEQTEIDAYAEKTEAEFRKFSEAVNSGKYGPAIDAALLQLIMTKYDSFVASHEPLEDYFSDETLHKIKVIQRYEFYYLTVTYTELSMAASSITTENQTDFDSRLEIADNMVSSMFNCTADKHSFGDDLVCDFCGELKEIEECENCGRKHLADKDTFICILIRLIKMLFIFTVSLVK